MHKKDPATLSLADLAYLVEVNDLPAIKQVVSNEKAKNKDGRWYYSSSSENYVEKAMRDAILLDQEDTVRFFLAEGLDANTCVDTPAAFKQKRSHYVPLMYFAAMRGNLTLVKLLLENGAAIEPRGFSFNSIDDYDAGIKAAVKYGHHEVAEYLLQHGADPNASFSSYTRSDGVTPLLVKAAQKNDVKMVEVLVRHGADVPRAIIRSYERIHETRYKEYNDQLKINYSDQRRIEKITSALNIDFRSNSDLYVNYSYTKQGKELLELINSLFIDLLELKNSIPKMLELRDLILSLVETYNLPQKYSRKRVERYSLGTEVIKLVDELIKFDKEKYEIEHKAKLYKKRYVGVVRLLMDYATGSDFKIKPYKDTDILAFLKDINLDQMNFVGVSINGIPFSKETFKDPAFLNKQNILLTAKDLERLLNKERQQKLQHRLQVSQQTLGRLEEKDGVINLVPLPQSVREQNKEAVLTRLNAGADPNQELGYGEEYPLIAAVKANNLELTKLLVNVHEDFKNNRANELVSIGKEQLLNKPTGTFYINNGQVENYVPVTCMQTTKFYSVVTKKNHQSFTYEVSKIEKQQTAMLHEFAKYTEDGLDIVATLYQGQIKYLLLPKENSTEAKKNSIKTFLNDVRGNNLQIIFSNNSLLLETLVEESYKKMEKSKSLIVEAIQIARDAKKFEMADYLENLQDVNQQDSYGDTLLHNAVLSSDSNRVKRSKELLAKNVNVNIENKHGDTALSLVVARCGDDDKDRLEMLEILQLLLTHKAEVDMYTVKKAIEAGSIEAFKMLLPALPKQNIQKRDYLFIGKTNKEVPWYAELMLDAVSSKTVMQFLAVLKDYGADFSISEYGEQLLKQAIRRIPSYAQVRARMRSTMQMVGGCEDRAENKINNTYNAIIENDKKRLDKALALVNYLLDNVTSYKIRDKRNHPLLFLLKEVSLSYLGDKGYTQLFDKLLKKCGQIKYVDEASNSLLHIAASVGDVTAMKCLINHRADINLQNNIGNTPLHIAAINCDFSMMQALLNSDADISLTNKDGLLPIVLLNTAYKKARENLCAEMNKVDFTGMRYFTNPNYEDGRHQLLKEKLTNFDKNYIETINAFNSVYEKNLIRIAEFDFSDETMSTSQFGRSAKMQRH